jgi:hypothetical protein
MDITYFSPVVDATMRGESMLAPLNISMAHFTAQPPRPMEEGLIWRNPSKCAYLAPDRVFPALLGA